MKIPRQIYVIISGKVIGVSFRAWTKTQADFLGLTGWVKNVGDHVEAFFQGDEEKISQMLQLLKLGPPSSQVKKVDVLPENNKEVIEKFEIRKY